MTFIEEQAKKEMLAAKKVWGAILNLCIVSWGIYGLILLTTSGWLLGVIFIGAAWYVYHRINGDNQGTDKVETPKANENTK